MIGTIPIAGRRLPERAGLARRGRRRPGEASRLVVWLTVVSLAKKMVELEINRKRRSAAIRPGSRVFDKVDLPSQPVEWRQPVAAEAANRSANNGKRIFAVRTLGFAANLDKPERRRSRDAVNLVTSLTARFADIDPFKA